MMNKSAFRYFITQTWPMWLTRGTGFESRLYEVAHHSQCCGIKYIIYVAKNVVFKLYTRKCVNSLNNFGFIKILATIGTTNIVGTYVPSTTYPRNFFCIKPFLNLSGP
jgi:hypothetical protein